MYIRRTLVTEHDISCKKKSSSIKHLISNGYTCVEIRSYNGSVIGDDSATSKPFVQSQIPPRHPKTGRTVCADVQGASERFDRKSGNRNRGIRRSEKYFYRQNI